MLPPPKKPTKNTAFFRGLKDVYDFIVVGSGSAGCAVAARLGRMGASVLLVEAGGEAQRSDRTQRAREAFRCWQSEHLGYCEGLL